MLCRYGPGHVLSTSGSVTASGSGSSIFPYRVGHHPSWSAAGGPTAATRYNPISAPLWQPSGSGQYNTYTHQHSWNPQLQHTSQEHSQGTMPQYLLQHASSSTQSITSSQNNLNPSANQGWFSASSQNNNNPPLQHYHNSSWFNTHSCPDPMDVKAALLMASMQLGSVGRAHYTQPTGGGEGGGNYLLTPGGPSYPGSSNLFGSKQQLSSAGLAGAADSGQQQQSAGVSGANPPPFLTTPPNALTAAESMRPHLLALNSTTRQSTQVGHTAQ